MKILVASLSQIKLDGVVLAFKGRTDLIVDGKKSASKVNEQPRGWEQIAWGAANRLESLMNMSGYDYHVSIENGIVQMDNRWFDFGWVQAVNSLGKMAVAQTAGVEFPFRYVHEAWVLGFETTTVGMVMAQRCGCSADDPHLFITGGMVSRRDLISQSVRIAIGQILLPEHLAQ